MVINKLQNEHRKITATMGSFSILENARDESVSPTNAVMEYFMAKMGVRRRQIIATLKGDNTIVTQGRSYAMDIRKYFCNNRIKRYRRFFG